METVKVEVSDRCPECGAKIDPNETITLVRDPVDASKGKAWHPECYAKDNITGGRGRWEGGW